MKQILLDDIFISNFRSYKHGWSKLSDDPGLKLFSGLNLLEPRLGANGAGKSTFWEAIVWVFYGVGIKGAKTASVLQWNQKTTEVLVDLNINGKIHSIYRCGPPMKIELDEKPATQEDIDRLLGLTREQFLHSVVFGQGVSLFPDLPIPQRGELLDSVLNLDIWEKASKTATDRCSTLEKMILQMKIEQAKIEGQISQLQPDEQLIKSRDEWDMSKKATLSELNKKKKGWQEQKDADIRNKLDHLQNLESELQLKETYIAQMEIADLSEFYKSLDESEESLRASHQNIVQLESDLKHITKPLDFWINNNACPTCKQPIVESQKQFHIQEIHNESQRISDDLSKALEAYEALKVLVADRKATLHLQQTQAAQQSELKRSYQREVASATKQIAELEVELEQLTSQNENPYESQISSTKASRNPYNDLIEKNKQVREKLEEERGSKSTEITQVQSSLVAVEYWKHGFKRIRLYFINQILTALQIEIQSALSALGLDQWSICLATETETKSGTTKLGVQIKIKSPIAEGEWSSWSGGESQRLRLAIAMGLASLIQRACGVFYGWETWDEPTTWLGNEGIEDLLEALQYRSTTLKKSIWVIDHRALQFAGFKEIWQVTKDQNGSSISLISQSEV